MTIGLLAPASSRYVQFMSSSLFVPQLKHLSHSDATEPWTLCSYRSACTDPPSTAVPQIVEPSEPFRDRDRA